VGAHDDVGSLAGRNLLDEVVLHVIDRLAREFDLDAGLVLVGVRSALQCVDAFGIDPDDQLPLSSEPEVSSLLVPVEQPASVRVETMAIAPAATMPLLFTFIGVCLSQC
jgi:hypothetical protein